MVITTGRGTRTMAAAEGESLEERRSATPAGESSRTTEAAETSSDMETDCGPEDVIRWSWSQDESNTGSCWHRITQSSEFFDNSEEEEVEEITKGHRDGGGGTPCATTTVNVMQRLNIISDKVTSPECCPPTTKSSGSSSRRGSGNSSSSRRSSAWTPRLSFCNCLKRPRHSFLVAALLCTHLMLWSSLATVAFASRQEGEWWPWKFCGSI